jgi:hypothetical protein
MHIDGQCNSTTENLLASCAPKVRDVTTSGPDFCGPDFTVILVIAAAGIHTIEDVKCLADIFKTSMIQPGPKSLAARGKRSFYKGRTFLGRLSTCFLGVCKPFADIRKHVLGEPAAAPSPTYLINANSFSEGS